MWKVLVADDEPKIRRGLRSSIEGLRGDMSVVAEAEDGEMALAMVEEHSPDILLVDVRMPFLDGLELIERIKERGSDCIIIVVSGHDEFEYAQKALQLKAFDFLLKPVSRETLAGVLDRAAAELEARRRNDRYREWAREQLARTMPLLVNQFLRDWARGRLSRTECDEQAGFLGVRLSDVSTMVVVHVVEKPTSADFPREGDRQITLIAMRGVVQDALRGQATVHVFTDDEDDIVGVVGQVSPAEWAEALARIEENAARALVRGIAIAHGPVTVATAPEVYETLKGEIIHKGGYRAIVTQAQGYIDTHYTRPELSLEDVSAACQISAGYLSRLLKQETGFSFVDYLARVRVSAAMRMMGDPAVKVYEVAEAVGYQSQHYFSRAFKRVFGRPPVEFRRGASAPGDEA